MNRAGRAIRHSWGACRTLLGEAGVEELLARKRAALPAELPRVDMHYEPDSTTCQCGCQLKRIGQDVSEKLDYTPGVLTVERHIRGKCSSLQTADFTGAAAWTTGRLSCEN